MTNRTMVQKSSPEAAAWNLYPQLGNLSVGYMQDDDDFVGSWFFPWVQVMEASAQYPTFSRSHFSRHSMGKRSDGNRSNEGGFDVAWTQLKLDVRGLHTKLGQQLRANVRMADIDNAAVEYLTEQSKLDVEIDFFDNFFKAGVWQDLTGVASGVGAGEFLSWADDNAKPIRDLKLARRMCRTGGGKPANKAIFTEAVWDVFSQHPNVISLVNGGQTVGMAEVTTEAVAKYLRLTGGIKIAAAVETTSAAGAVEASQTYDYIGTDGVLLGHVAESPGLLKASAGYNFSWNGYLGGAANKYGAAFRRWYEDGPNAYFHEVEQSRAIHKVSSGLGVFLASPLAT